MISQEERWALMEYCGHGRMDRASCERLVYPLSGFMQEDPREFRWPRLEMTAVQALLCSLVSMEAVGALDGYDGPQTRLAYDLWDSELPGLKLTRSDEGPARGTPANSPWPSPDKLAEFYGEPGGRKCTGSRVVIPWAARLAWDPNTRVRFIRCHDLVAGSLNRIFSRIADTYSAGEIASLGLSKFGGCYNYRKKRGGSTLSTHSWGIALDWDPERNALGWTRQKARLAQSDAVPFWEAWEAEGWVSLGRARGFDWMHVQACTL